MTLAAIIFAAVLSAATAAPPEPPPPPEKPAEPPADTGQPLPSLDELLGTSDPKSGGTPDPSADAKPVPPPTNPDLERTLNPDAPKDPFAQAVGLMNQTAQRLSTKDIGLDTQRLQQDTLKHLDKLIEEAQRRRSNQRQRQQQRSQQQQQQQANQSSQAGQRPQQSPTSDPGASGPPRQDGDLSPPQLSGSAAWGNLPPHLRADLMQGFSDKFSAMYRRLTEQYYRRLAEEPKP